MVKLSFYFVKKPGKKDMYVYEEVCLRFPTELHDFLQCLRDRQLEIKATRNGNTTYILLIDNQI